MNYTIESGDLFKKTVSWFNILFIPSEANDYSPLFLQSKILMYFVILFLLIRITTIGVFVPWPQNIFFADITKIDLVHLLNQSRENAGLKDLTENNALNQAALLKAQDMVANDYFAHQSPAGITPWFWFRQAGYNYKYAGENLAVGFFDSNEVFDAWLNSPSHKENIMNPNYNDVGTAILSGFDNSNTLVVVQLFGKLQMKTAALNTHKKLSIPPPTPINNAPKKVAINPDQSATEQKVLGQSMAQSIKINTLTSNTGIIQSDTYSQFMHFIVYDYEELITDILYVLLVVICGSLLLNIVINFKIQRGQLIARSLVLICIIVGALFLNKDLVNHIVPSQVLIQNI